MYDTGVLCKVGTYTVTVSWTLFSVTAVYISPNASDRDYDEMIDELEKVVENPNINSLIIEGDFNFWSLLWGSDYTSYRGDKLTR